MALETPNAIAAAAVVRFDPDAVAGSQFSIVSSNGILAKLAEFAITGLGGPLPAAAYSFESPITSLEACVTSNIFSLIADNTGITPSPGVVESFAQVKAGAINDPSYDAQPDGALVVVIASPPPAGAPAFVSVQVVRIPRG
jgi:hypothetical protein